MNILVTIEHKFPNNKVSKETKSTKIKFSKHRCQKNKVWYFQHFPSKWFFENHSRFLPQLFKLYLWRWFGEDIWTYSWLQTCATPSFLKKKWDVLVEHLISWSSHQTPLCMSPSHASYSMCFNLKYLTIVHFRPILRKIWRRSLVVTKWSVTIRLCRHDVILVHFYLAATLICLTSLCDFCNAPPFWIRMDASILVGDEAQVMITTHHRIKNMKITS